MSDFTVEVRLSREVMKLEKDRFLVERINQVDEQFEKIYQRIWNRYQPTDYREIEFHRLYNEYLGVDSDDSENLSEVLRVKIELKKKMYGFLSS